MNSGEVFLSVPSGFEWMERRRVVVRRGTDYLLQFVALGGQIECYLDGVLMINAVRDEPSSGLTGLFIDRGRAVFSDFNAHALQ